MAVIVVVAAAGESRDVVAYPSHWLMSSVYLRCRNCSRSVVDTKRLERNRHDHTSELLVVSMVVKDRSRAGSVAPLSNAAEETRR